MNKAGFELALYKKLSSLPRKEVAERLSFYLEMIDDRMEDGISEEEAVTAAGSVDEIAAQILADIPLAKIAKERVKPKKRMKTWEILLLALGSPIWLSLLIAAFAVILSLYAALWSVIISLWAVFVSLVACAFCGVIVGIAFVLHNEGFAGIAMLGAGILCAGLSIFLFYGCKVATKGAIAMPKALALGMKKRIIKKEEV